MLVTVLGMETVAKSVQPENTSAPMLVAPLGMVIAASLAQPLNTELSSFVILAVDGISTFVSMVQFWNALAPIVEIELGIEMLSKELHERNAMNPIDVNALGRVSDFKERQPLKA